MKRVVKLASVVILAVTVVNFVKTMGKLSKVASEVKELEAEVSGEEREGKVLRARITQAESVEYVEGQAREKLGMAREGEVVVVLPIGQKGEQGGDGVEKEKVKENWRLWLEMFGWGE